MDVTISADQEAVGKSVQWEPIVHLLDVPRLESYCSPDFFRILASPYREAYWAVLVRAYQRKFLAAPAALTRPEAIDIAESVLEGAQELGVDPAKLVWEEGWDLPALEDDNPRASPLREPARRLLRMLAHAGWIYFQTYADERFPVLEFTLIGQRQVSHMLRDLRGERLPLRSFADRLGELVGNRCNGMRMAPGRLRQLREVVAQLNERIHELLGGIKAQSEGVVARARTIRAILSDLLVDFERHVGYDYALLKRRESPPRLWAAVMQAVHDLRDDPVWMHRETEWYREQLALDHVDAAQQAVLGDLLWVSNVMDNLSRANDLLDQRYSRYVSLSRRRVESQLRQTYNLADGLQALIEAAAAGRIELERVQVAKVVSIGPVGFTYDRTRRQRPPNEPLEEVTDLSEEEARRHRLRMDDSIPIAEIRSWLGSHPERVITVSVDDLPVADRQDYLRHIFAGFYATEGKGGIGFTPESCGTAPFECPTPDTCMVCYRRDSGFRVPRGAFTVDPSTTRRT